MASLYQGILASGSDLITRLSGSWYHARFTAKCVRHFSHRSTLSSKQYWKTIRHLDIGAHTRVIFQGFTGRQATQNAKQSLEYGTKIVGGVTPGKDGEHLGLPVLPTVRAAKERLSPDATAVYVAAGQAASAIEEAIEAEIPLIVAVAEHIPTIDLVRVREMLNTQSRSRLVGPNSPGIMSAVGKCRIGFQPLPCFRPGVVGIVARSGTLSYETVASTTRAGIGQSLVIGMGGDISPGTDFVDALTLFEHHKDTRGIILVGEIGGEAERAAAQWISEYRERVEQPKPIMALMAGYQAPFETVMGHAGAFARRKHETTGTKAFLLGLEDVVLVNHPSDFGVLMKQMLDYPKSKRWHSLAYDSFTRPVSSKTAGKQSSLKRAIHTFTKRSVPVGHNANSSTKRRGHFLSSERCLKLLDAYEIPIATQQPEDYRKDNDIRNGLKTFGEFLSATRRSADYGEDIDVRIDVDRPSGQLQVTVCWTDDLKNPVPGKPMPETTIPIDELTKSKSYGESVNMWRRAPACFNLRTPFPRRNGAGNTSRDPTDYLPKLMQLFIDEEAFSIFVRFRGADDGSNFVYQVYDAKIGLDALVYQGPQISPDGAERQQVKLNQAEEAAKDGIVYVKLRGAGTIGTLVNGAGLAMNTIDAVTDQGGECANFLDTGGKATSATVKTSFQLILADPRVKVIFVNIFGGLTLCDMIAEGIMLAYKDLGIEVPVVVRLRGTNEEIGQKMIAESGLPLHAFDDFEEAGLKAIELARNTRNKTS